MKTYILLLLFVPLFSFAQNTDSTYVSKSGVPFKVGQKVTLGLGSGIEGKFKYVVAINILGLPDQDDHLAAEYATQEVTIYKIKRQKATLFKKDSSITVYLMFKTEQLLEKYGINVEAALLAKEIIIN